MIDRDWIDWLYCITTTSELPDFSCRIGALHSEVFHGTLHRRPIRDKSSPKVPKNAQWFHIDDLDLLPAPAFITRSGRFVPPVSMPYPRSLVVNEQVFNLCKDIPNVQGTEVSFETLVDLPMPSLGDMSWYDPKARRYKNPDPRSEYRRRPDVPEFHRDIGAYYELTGVFSESISDRFPDFKTVTPNHGTYPGAPCERDVNISFEAMKTFPIVDNVYRQDVFSIIAPFLDLDYFAVAIIYPENCAEP